MSEARALTNLVGNAVATIVVAKWVKELDTDQLQPSWPRAVAVSPTSVKKMTWVWLKAQPQAM